MKSKYKQGAQTGSSTRVYTSGKRGSVLTVYFSCPAEAFAQQAPSFANEIRLPLMDRSIAQYLSLSLGHSRQRETLLHEDSHQMNAPPFQQLVGNPGIYIPGQSASVRSKLHLHRHRSSHRASHLLTPSLKIHSMTHTEHTAKDS